MRLYAFILLIMLAGCTAPSTETPAPMPDTDTSVPTNGPSTPEPEAEAAHPLKPWEKSINNYTDTVERTTPLILDGTEEFVVEDTYFKHNNDIVLRDNARLIVRDAAFEHQVSYDDEYTLKAYDNSSVILDNVQIRALCTGSVVWSFRGTARFTASTVEQVDCNTWNSLTENVTATIRDWDWFSGNACGAATMDVAHSRNLEIELCYESGAILDTRLPLEVDELTIPNEEARNIPATYILRNATLDGWGINVEPNTSVTIRDSPRVTVGIIMGLPWEHETVDLEGLDRTHYSDRTWTLVDSTLRLVNTTTYGWEANVFAHNNTLIIRNSNFTGPTINSDHSTEIVEHSVMDTVHAFEHMELFIRHSHVRDDVIARDSSTIHLTNTTVNGDLIEEGEAEIIVE